MSKKVLVVDDEQCIADTLAIILRHAGYDAAVCYDGESALRHCHSATPDLVISDVAMPGMNGLDLAILIREQYPLCSILLFSGQAATLDLLEEARRRGYYFELLRKPLHPKELLEKLAATLMPSKPRSMTTARIGVTDYSPVPVNDSANSFSVLCQQQDEDSL